MDYSNCDEVQTSFLPVDTDRMEKNNCKNSDDEDDAEDEDDIYCGVGSCRPSFLQGCKNMACFTAVCSVVGLVTAALNFYMNSQITTLEKHFNFSSSVSGFIMSCNDIGYLATCLVMAYYTRRVHVPRVLALCCLLYGLSSLVCTIAFFGTRHQIPSPPKDSDVTKTVTRVNFIPTCSNITSPSNASCQDVSNRTKATIEVSDWWRTFAICMLSVGMILQGVAKSPRVSFVATYVDDNVPKTKTTLHLGIVTGVGIFGPTIAFTLGGVFSSMYITLEETSMSTRDPRWLGAWWLGFLIFGGCSFVVCIPLIFFPRRMHKQKQLEHLKQKKKKEQKGQKRLFRDFKDFWRSMRRLAVNPVYMCLVLGNAVGFMSVSGLTAFWPKYLEAQFTLTASKANLMFGATQIITGSCGTIVGGCLTSRLKLAPITCLKVLIGFTITITAVLSLGFFIGCDNPVIHTGLDTYSSGAKVISQCVQACNCDWQNFFPVCGSDMRNYFSPCHAGCSSMDRLIFTNCTCLASNETLMARSGLCIPDCKNVYQYLILTTCAAFILTFIVMPYFVVCVRSVQEEDKPLALGISAFAGTLIGWFPGPVIYGAVIDTTCILWKTTCTSVGACSLYDLTLLRFRFHALAIGLRIISLIFYVTVLILSLYSKKVIFQPQDLNTKSSSPRNAKNYKKEAEIKGTDIALIVQTNPAMKENNIK